MERPHQVAMTLLKPFRAEMTREVEARFGLFALCDFGDHFGSFLESVVGSRYSAIDCLLQDDLLDVVGVEPALRERRPHMHSELFPLVEREHRANHKNAARPLIIVRAGPDIAPSGPGYEILEFLVERILFGIGPIDPRIAEHLATLGHSALITFLVIHKSPQC